MGLFSRLFNRVNSTGWMLVVQNKALDAEPASKEWHDRAPQEVKDFAYARAFARWGEPSLSKPPQVHKEIQIASAKWINGFLSRYNDAIRRGQSLTDLEALAKQTDLSILEPYELTYGADAVKRLLAHRGNA